MINFRDQSTGSNFLLIRLKVWSWKSFQVLLDFVLLQILVVSIVSFEILYVFRLTRDIIFLFRQAVQLFHKYDLTRNPKVLIIAVNITSVIKTKLYNAFQVLNARKIKFVSKMANDTSV